MNWALSGLNALNDTFGSGNARAVANQTTSTVLQHLHNLAPNTFPPANMQAVAGNNLYGGSSPVLDAITYVRSASMEMLCLHDSSLPICLRELYKKFLFSNQVDTCRTMDVVFTLMHQSRAELLFYKDIALLASGVLTSRLPKLLPLDRSIRGTDITLHDVFNHVSYRMQQVGGDLMSANRNAARPENPYMRMLRTMIFESLREFTGNTDKRIFKENQSYDETDSQLLTAYVQMHSGEHISPIEPTPPSVGREHPSQSEVPLPPPPPPPPTVSPAKPSMLPSPVLPAASLPVQPPLSVQQQPRNLVELLEQTVPRDETVPIDGKQLPIDDEQNGQIDNEQDGQIDNEQDGPIDDEPIDNELIDNEPIDDEPIDGSIGGNRASGRDKRRISLFPEEMLERINETKRARVLSIDERDDILDLINNSDGGIIGTSDDDDDDDKYLLDNGSGF